MPDLATEHNALRARLGLAARHKPIRLELIGRRKPSPALVETRAETDDASPAQSGPAPFNFLKAPGWKAIVKLVAIRHRVAAEEILGAARLGPIVRARHEAIYLINRHCEMNLRQIGDCFGRDNTTVLHALRKVARQRGEKW